MEIIKFPDERLLTPCKPVTVFTPELKILLQSMWETMVAAKGVGLSANQVGLEYRMFVMDEHIEKHFIVNPVILEAGKLACDLAEGCLSAPGQTIKLNRPNWVTLRYQDENGEFRQRTFVGIYSVCVQHEIEHLDGKSFLLNKAIPKKLRIFLASKWGLKVK
jgi:peptide deformylase